MTIPDEAASGGVSTPFEPSDSVRIQVSPGCWECARCDYPITFDGGLQIWVHWWNGSSSCTQPREESEA